MDVDTPNTEQALRTVGLKQAAAIFDTTTGTLRRRIKAGKLPEAVKVEGKYGDEYTLAIADLSAIADRNNWVLGLDALNEQGLDSASPAQSKYLEELTERLINAEGLAIANGMQLDERDKQLTQTRNDLEAERAEANRLQTDLITSERERGKLEGQLEQAHKSAKSIGLELDSLDLEHRELQKSSAESISDLSNKLNGAQKETEAAVGERDELAKKLAQAEASMGWWTRRKYDKD